MFIAHLGHGDSWGEYLTSPRPMQFLLAASLPRVVQVAAGSLHSVLLCEDGRVFTCGGGWEGALGHGSQASEDLLKPVAALMHEIIVSVAAGASHSLAVTARGSVYSWGWGRAGALGHEDQASQHSPRKIRALAAVCIRKVEAGLKHSVATAANGVAYEFGTTDEGNVQHLEGQVASHAELPYEPRVRYQMMARQLREPRGTKSGEHLRLLRKSSPRFSSLSPRRSLPACYELPYDLMARHVVTARELRTPRGSKSAEHLEVLRTSNPCRVGPLATAPPPPPPPRDSSSTGMRRQVSLTELSKMTRNLSVDSFVCSETEELPELPCLHDSWPMRQRLRYRREGGKGLADGAAGADGFECDSEHSAARTHERASSISASNSLDDFDSTRSSCSSPERLHSLRRPEGHVFV